MPPPRRGLPVHFHELYLLREEIFQDHVTYQQGLLYFLANDPQVPKELKERAARFGLDPNEFRETGYSGHSVGAVSASALSFSSATRFFISSRFLISALSGSAAFASSIVLIDSSNFFSWA